MPEAPNRNIAFARALVGALRRAGVEHLCLCPGSRSAPLVLAAVDESESVGSALRLWTHLDERSAAFFAIGLARATRRPVVLVATSGTAGANFFPAVVEAHHARVPLIVLTADRPPELRDRGAGQTIDQMRLFGVHVRWFAELATPDPSAQLLPYVRSVASRAVASALGVPRGPVHLNLPFREPLDRAVLPADALGTDSTAERGAGARPFTRVHEAAPRPPEAALAALARRVRQARRGVLMVGPLDLDPAEARELAGIVDRLARRTGWPVLADALSGLGRGPGGSTADPPGLSRSFDALLRDGAFAERAGPDLILRLGDSFTSKAVRVWREQHDFAYEVLVDPDRVWHDPSALVHEIFRASPVNLLSDLLHRLESDSAPCETDPEWSTFWRAGESTARRVLDRELGAQVDPDGALTEPRIVRELDRVMPEGALLVVSSSMPVRDVDSFLEASPRSLRVVAQRGANGIDGVTSTALGWAAGLGGSVVLLTGDLAFLHDVGGLLAARRNGLRVVIVVVNNDGGGIFSYLPIAGSEEPAHFERHFGTPHGLDLSGAAKLYRLDHEEVRTPRSLREAVGAALKRSGTTIVEAQVHREQSMAHHRAIWSAVGEELARAGDGA